MKKYGELTRLLDFMEENIDIDHIRKIEQLQYDAINYKKVDRLPLTICTASDDFEQIPTEIAFDNPEMMLFNEILCSSSIHSAYNSVRMKDDSSLMIRSNHGSGIIASMFGCKTSFSSYGVTETNPITLDEAKKIFAKGAPNTRAGLGKKVIDTYMYYHERLESYPKCYRTIRITQPDINGPFGILHSIIGSLAFLLTDKNPDLAKYMIDVITHTYINFRREVDLLLTDRINDAIFVNGLCCGGRVFIKSDCAAAQLPDEMYKLYEEEPESYIIDAFSSQGGGSICYCGETRPLQKKAIPNKNLRCVNYSNPDKHDLNEEYEHYREHNIAIVGWGYDKKYSQIKETLNISNDGNPIKTGMTLICRADSTEDGIEILKTHRNN